MNKNLVNEVIMTVLKSGRVLCMNNVSFRLTYRGDDIYCLTAVNDTYDRYSISEYLIKLDEDKEMFTPYSES